jgi:hypothetical protein
VTPVGDELFFASGYYGNTVFSANAATGGRLWSAAVTSQYGGYVMQGESVAVDQQYVYFFQGGAIVALKRGGSLAKFIQNPFFSKNGISYFGKYVGAPMLDGNGRIFTFTDNRSIGQALPIAAFRSSTTSRCGERALVTRASPPCAVIDSMRSGHPVRSLT